MKNKDYVSQPKRQKRNNAKKPQKAPFPVVKLGVLISLIAAFGYFLFFLKDSAPEAEQKSATTKQTKTKSEKVLPPLPDDERWEFIDELKNKEVTVDKGELKDKGPFMLRCTTVRSKQRAEALKAKIAFAGHESVVKEYQGTSGLWYRVDLGPYDKKREAEKVRHVMKRNNINGCTILLWR